MIRRWSPIATIALLLLAGAACTDFSLDGEGDDTGGSPEDTATDTDTNGGTDDTATPSPDPSWIAVSGTLTVASGSPSAATSTLAIEYRLDPSAPPPEIDTADADAAPAVPCTRTPAITEITAAEAPDAAITMGWWSFSLDAAPDPTCPFDLPEGLHLGIGEIDGQLYAAMDLAGLSSAQSALYGLYVRLGDETAPVWVYGVVGTAEQYGGTASATAPPLPDGAYTLTALHLLPYTPAP